MMFSPYSYPFTHHSYLLNALRAAMVSNFIDPKRNLKYQPTIAKPRDTPPPTCADIDYNKDWVPEKSDQYLGYKTWFIIDASEKFLDDVSTTAAHYMLYGGRRGCAARSV